MPSNFIAALAVFHLINFEWVSNQFQKRSSNYVTALLFISMSVFASVLPSVFLLINFYTKIYKAFYAYCVHADLVHQ